MTPEEYKQKRQQIISDYMEEICEHESAGCFGDAGEARKWMRVELEKLERECEEGA